MSLRLFLLERHMPAVIRRRVFSRLARATADAFGVPPPDLARLSPGEDIERFAQFTRTEAERALASGPSSDLARDRLYAGALDLGTRVRRLLGIRRPDEAFRAVRLLYAAIGIDAGVDSAGCEIVIERCAFSRVYTPEVCAFVSALDAGVVAGLTGVRTLVFTARLTEGAPQCRARLVGGTQA